MNAVASYRDTRPYKVDLRDLLPRPEILLDQSEVIPLIRDKCVLVTGGGGSIGSELCRQLVPIGPRQIIVFDIYENTAYELLRELEHACLEHGVNFVIEIGSILDASKLNKVFLQYKPDIVFHAAAHKHVPLMEHDPVEAVFNNVLGTKRVIEAANAARVNRFTLISTDKAVNPTSVMGATKRVCELMVRSANLSMEITCLAVRFGNVLGSHGSVLPLFEQQMRSGGPVTVTHKDITRFFMTIPEASRLVIAATALAHGGEIFLLQMGHPVKIIDLAQRFIALSGYSAEEMPIQIVGLRPGEKLYEELILENEKVVGTGNKDITVCIEDDLVEDIPERVDRLIDLANKDDQEGIRIALGDLTGLSASAPC